MSGRFGRSARIVAAAGGILVLCGLVIWGAARSGAVDAWLTTSIAARLDHGLSFSSARAVWWPRLGVVLDDVAIDPVADVPTLGLASAAAVTCRVRLAALLGGRVEIGSVRVDGLQLAVARSADGALHAGGLEALAAQAAGGGEPPGGGLFPSVPMVRVHGATLEYRRDDDSAVPPLRLEGVGAQLTPSGAGAGVELTARVDGGGTLRVDATLDFAADLAATAYRARLDAEALDAAAVLAWLPPVNDLSAHGRLRVTTTLSGRGAAPIAGDVSIELFDGALTWTEWQGNAPLHLEAHAAWDGGALALSQGRVNAARLARGALAAETLEATFNYGDGALQVEAAELRACGGTWRPTGRVTLSEPPHVDASLQAEAVDATQLAAALKTFGVSEPLPQLTAPLRLAGHASGVLGGAWSGQATVATDGALTWSNAHVEGPIEVGADAALAGSAVSLSNGRAQARRVAVGGLVLDALDAGFSYARGAVQVAPLRCTAYGGTWTYSGTLPVGDTAAWRGQLAGSGVSAAALRSALAAPGGGTDGAVDLHAQLAGTGTRAANGSATARLASAALTWDDLRVEAPAEVSAALHIQGTRLAISNGQARARTVRVQDVTATDVSSAFTYADASLRIAGLEARAFRGRWEASGAIRLGATPTWNGSVQAHHIDLDALLDEVERLDSVRPHSTGGVADLSVKMNREADGDMVGSATVNLTAGSFTWDDLHVQGPAHGTGSFSLRGETFSLPQATAQASRAAYGPLVTTDAAAEFEYAAQRLSFADLRFNSCGGKWSHSGWFTLAEGGKFAGQLSIEGAVPRHVAEMLGTRGTDVSFARLDLDSEFAGRAVDDFPARLQATGSVFLTDGSMRSASVLRPIWEAIVGPGRVTEAMARPTTRVQQLSSLFAVHGGRVNTTDFSLISDDYHVTAFGSIGLDGSLDLDARIQVTAQGVQKMLVFGSLPLPTYALPGLPPIPADVTGSLTDPVIRPNLSALPTTTVKWLVEALLQTPRSLGESVVHGLGQVWNGAKRAVGAGP